MYPFSSKTNNDTIRRLRDVIFVISILPLASSLFFLGCVLSLITLKQHPIYSQIRIGKNGKEFRLYKIKTMKSHLENEISLTGNFLRKSKIDELPQLFNVLIGNMSIIGPRPEQPHYVKKFLEKEPTYSLRHRIKPGITGLAQVYLPRATPKDNLKKLEYDLFYIRNYSMKLDFIIILKTLKIILTLDSN